MKGYPFLWWVMLACSLGIIALALLLVDAHREFAAWIRCKRRRRLVRAFKFDGPRP